jgi:hypothetical protein
MSGGGGSGSDKGGGGGGPPSVMNPPSKTSNNIPDRGRGQQYTAPKSKPKPTVTVGGGGGRDIMPVTKTKTTSPKVNYTTRDDVREQQRGTNQYYRARTQAAQVDAEDEYDAPDKEHFAKTQRQIKTTSGKVVDTTMSQAEYDKFNKELNEYYGTEGVKYEPYGRAGKGTVNLTFAEHYKNVTTENPALKLSPTLAFLAASGRNAKEYLTSDYGTYKYAGPGTDQGGLLGRLGTGATQQETEREIMRNLAPDAPYIVSGIEKPRSSPAADFFAKMNTNKNELFFNDQYNMAKTKVQGILGTPSPMRYLALNESPFYNWLKDNSLDKGIL